ncbi:MAG TPA: response regulator transcription factor [Gammaproteobacteria bacterium]|nr:response regulator transcription factor [Gammaproteobacteria bacterium]
MRILIIDDHALFRVGLEGLLEQRGIEVVASVGDAYEGLRKLKALQPDILLLDVRMPGLNGLEALRQLAETKLTTQVVMLTTSAEKVDLAEALRNGARGYLLKDMAPDDLLVALRSIQSGKTVIAPELTTVLAKLVQSGDDVELEVEHSLFKKLTPREQEILCHLTEGQSNKVIARHLGISDGTVKLHVKAILRKLRIHSRVEAAVMAVEQGFCSRG